MSGFAKDAKKSTITIYGKHKSQTIKVHAQPSVHASSIC